MNTAIKTDLSVAIVAWLNGDETNFDDDNKIVVSWINRYAQRVTTEIFLTPTLAYHLAATIDSDEREQYLCEIELIQDYVHVMAFNQSELNASWTLSEEILFRKTT